MKLIFDVFAFFALIFVRSYTVLPGWNHILVPLTHIPALPGMLAAFAVAFFVKILTNEVSFNREASDALTALTYVVLELGLVAALVWCL